MLFTKRWFGSLASFVCAIFVGAILLSSCSAPAPKPGDNLRLAPVASLFERTKDAHEFEHMLNTSGINNLDLDEDGVVDPISVQEYGSGYRKGFSLTVDMGGGHIQQVAEIKMDAGMDGWVHYVIEGNSQLYGYGHYWSGRLHPSNALLLAWIFAPNRTTLYAPSYRYGYYPPTYTTRRVVEYKVYETHTVTIAKQSKVAQSVKQQKNAPAIAQDLKSPNEGKFSDIVKAPLVAPTQTQKQFQETNPSKTTLKGGFGGQKAKAPATGTTPSGGTSATPGLQKPDLAKPTQTQKQFREEDPKQTDLGKGGFDADKQHEVPKAALPPGSPIPLPPEKSLAPRAGDTQQIDPEDGRAKALEKAKLKAVEDARLKAEKGAALEKQKALEEKSAAEAKAKALEQAKARAEEAKKKATETEKTRAAEDAKRKAAGAAKSSSQPTKPKR